MPQPATIDVTPPADEGRFAEPGQEPAPPAEPTPDPAPADTEPPPVPDGEEKPRCPSCNAPTHFHEPGCSCRTCKAYIVKHGEAAPEPDPAGEPAPGGDFNLEGESEAELEITAKVRELGEVMGFTSERILGDINNCGGDLEKLEQLRLLYYREYNERLG
jgi:hypothetical protein